MSQANILDLLCDFILYKIGFILTETLIFLLKGPALYVYNDAVFSSDDWKGITMLSDSVKEKDPMKVGRFGLGFKSVFHLTGYSEFLFSYHFLLQILLKHIVLISRSLFEVISSKKIKFDLK